MIKNKIIYRWHCFRVDVHNFIYFMIPGTLFHCLWHGHKWFCEELDDPSVGIWWATFICDKCGKEADFETTKKLQQR
jgi:hypothetical protein